MTEATTTNYTETETPLEPTPERSPTWETDREFIALGQNIWGRGKTPEEAYRNCKQQSGMRGLIIVYNVPSGAQVTWMGDIEWEGADRPTAFEVMRQEPGKRAKWA